MNKFKKALSACDDIETGNITDLPTFWAEHGKTVFEALEMAVPSASDNVLEDWRGIAAGLFPPEIINAPHHAVPAAPTDKDAMEALSRMSEWVSDAFNGNYTIMEMLAVDEKTIRRALSAPAREGSNG